MTKVPIKSLPCTGWEECARLTPNPPSSSPGHEAQLPAVIRHNEALSFVTREKEEFASDAVPHLVEGAVRAILADKQSEARATLERIDFDRLIHELNERKAAFKELRTRRFKQHRELDPTREDRCGPTEAAKRALFERDSFTCWFCGKRTVYAPVLAGLSTVFNDLIPYRTGWKPKEEHILFWTCTPSWEHLRPVARGGSSSDPSNIVTSCYQCQDVRGNYLHTEIGWDAIQPVRSGWLGLSEQVEALYTKLGLSTVRPPIAPGTRLVGELSVGALIRATIQNKGKPYRNLFRVDEIEGDVVVLSGMWRVRPQDRWHVGNAYRSKTHDVINVEVIRDPAPHEGDT